MNDFHVECIDLLGNRTDGDIGVAFLVACYSTLKKASPLAGLITLGDLSIQGNIKSLRSLNEPLQVAMDNGARRVLVPIENKRQFLEVSADIVEKSGCDLLRRHAGGSGEGAQYSVTLIRTSRSNAEDPSSREAPLPARAMFRISFPATPPRSGRARFVHVFARLDNGLARAGRAKVAGRAGPLAVSLASIIAVLCPVDWITPTVSMFAPFASYRKITAGLLLLALAGSNPMPAAETARPNIVFILVDDLRWDALGCTGHPFVKTPGIDRIAREGARFRNGFVTTPLCFPSRASFLTGQYSHRHGIRLSDDRARLGHRLITFPLLLQRAGYATGFFGKWHLGNEQVPPPGMDRWVSFREQGEFVNPELLIDGTRVKTPGYLTDLLTDHAVEFIRRRHSKPFLLYLSHKGVHAPWMPAPRHRQFFSDIPIRRAASAGDTWDDKPVLRRPGVTLNPKDSDVHTTDDDIRNQLRCLLSIDEGVQRIFAALEETQRLEKTLIVFTSDNGYFWGEHQLGGKHGAYEEAIRVPLLMRHPRLVKPGSVIDGLALNIDLAPTLLEAAGERPPAEMQGRSLLPLLRGEAREVRSSFLAEFFLGNGTPRFPTWQAVRDTRWKYIRYPGMEEMNELYDLQADPLERRNLIHQAPEAARAMKAELDRLLAENKA